MTTLVIAANAPDVDIFSYFAGADAALAFRRGWTHGPLGILVLPTLVSLLLLVGYAFLRRSRPEMPRASARGVLGLAYLGTLSHPALDWLNTYGVRLLMPWSDHWYYGDALFIVDAWMWLILGSAAFLAQRPSRRRNGSWGVLAVIATMLLFAASDSSGGKCLWMVGLGVVVVLTIRGWPQNERQRSNLASALVAVFVVYILAMIGGARAARDAVALELAELGIEAVEELMVGPLPLTPFTREVIAATPSQIHFGVFRWLPSPHLQVLPSSRPRPSSHPAIAAAWADPCIRGFVGWARFPSAEVVEETDHYEVRLIDNRYTRSFATGFGSARVEIPHRRLD